jgi:hypothetical protein
MLFISPGSLRAGRSVVVAVVVAAATPNARAQDWRWQSPRPGSAGAYDSARERLVAVDPTSFELTAWDGRDWAAVPASPRPTGSSPAVAFDGARRKLVLVASAAVHETWEWDGFGWSLRPTPVAPPPRYSHGMAWHQATGQVVLFGGAAPSTNALLGDTWLWNGLTWERANVPGPSPRRFPSLAYDSVRQRTVLFGGSDPAGPLHDTWEWTGGSWQQRLEPGPSAIGFYQAMAYDEARGECVLFLSGFAPRGPEVWRWNGVAWSQALVASPWFGDTLVYFPPTRQTVKLDSGTWLWTGTGWTHPAPDEPRAYFAAMVFDSVRGVVVCCQSEGAGEPVSTTEWDGARWLRRPSLQQPPGENWRAVFDPVRAETLVFGGTAPGTGGGAGPGTDGTWLWDGSTWERRATAANSPPHRTHQGMAWDEARQRVVLFGGLVPGTWQLLGDTWEWDGSAWTARQPANAPSARYGAAMVYHPTVGRVVLAGGNNNANGLADTWHWDGTAGQWTSVQPPASPPGHAQLPFLWHAGRQRAVLLGAGYPAADWEYNGITWQPVAGGAARTMLMTAVHDPLRNVTVGYGYDGVWVQSATLAATAGYGSDCGARSPRITTFGAPRIGRDRFRVEAELPDVFGQPLLVVVGFAAANTPLPGGCSTLVENPASWFVTTNENGYGGITVAVPPDPVLRGTDLYWQAAGLDASAPGGFRTSRGLRTTVGD